MEVSYVFVCLFVFFKIIYRQWAQFLRSVNLNKQVN